MVRTVPWIAVLAVALYGAGHRPEAASQDPQRQHGDHEHSGAVEAMSQGHHGHHGEDPHMKLTAARQVQPGDRERADALVKTLRRALEPYRSSARAERDGYQPFLAQLPLPEHHFTNWRYGLLGAFKFSPDRPTSLLYRRTGGEYALAGAMYTAPARSTEHQLNERVPLSIGRWHLHANICLPPNGERRPDLTRFGFKGSIASKKECDAAGGRFLPQIFGWMIHVYPFEQDPARVWGH
jgi:hypothetical protein